MNRDQANRMVLTLALALAAAVLLILVGTSYAQAVCEGVTGNGRCNSANTISAIMPTTNADGTAFNDYATSEIVFGLTPNVCASTLSTVKNIGAVGVPITPTPNLRATTLLGPLGLPSAKVFVSWRVVDTTGNRGACATPEVSFTFDNVAPAGPTGLQVGP